MRSQLLLLAGLASYALALPAVPELDTRGFGLIHGVIDTITNPLQGQSPVNILGDISAEAAAALGGGALGCAAGDVDIKYRNALAAWIVADAGVHLDASLKNSLLAWCHGGASLHLSVDIRAQLSFFLPTCAKVAAEEELYVSLEGVFSLAKDIVGVLSVTAQASLQAAIALIGDLDWKIKAGLEFCAAGGVVADLDVEIVAALKAWLLGGECSLSVELKATVLAWIEGKIGGDVILLGGLPVGGVTGLSLGKAVEVLVDASGALDISAQLSLSAFLETEIAVDIDIEIKALLDGCAKGGLAISIEYEKRAALAVWLASPDCHLTAELKAIVLFWLSFGVSAGAEVSLGVSTTITGEITGFLTGTVDALLGTQLHGLISFILSGKGVLSLSLEARAQLAALCGGGLGIEVDSSIQIIIIGWLSGCHKCCGAPYPTTTPTFSLPTSIPTVTPTTTKNPGVPTGVEPSETPSETPCETTTETTISSTIPPAPTETESKPPTVPTDVEPTETPCETISTATTISSTITHPSEPSPSITEPPVPIATSTDQKTITITKTVSVEYCPS